MPARMLRYEVPIDDDDHTLMVRGEIKHIGCRSKDSLEFWTLSYDDVSEPRPLTFTVFGTGHDIVGNYAYRGTTYWTNPELVWHLFEKLTDAQMLGEMLTRGMF